MRPDYQGRGVGGDLIRAGLERAPAVGWKAVFLLGDLAYYARFGFELAAPSGFHRTLIASPALGFVAG